MKKLWKFIKYTAIAFFVFGLIGGAIHNLLACIAELKGM